MSFKISFITFVFVSCISIVNAQMKVFVEIDWLQNTEIRFSETEQVKVLNFKGAQHDFEHGVFPLFFKTVVHISLLENREFQVII